MLFFFFISKLSAVKGDRGILNVLIDFSLKDAIYAVAYVWSNVHKSTLIKAWHRLWHTMMLDNEPANEHFEGFHASSDEGMVSDIVT
jgi:hypothetical protein